MPNRILKESVKTSSEIDKLTWFEEVVFYRLMVSVDDYGCFDGRVIVIKNELFPTKENVTTKAVSDAIDKLERVKLLSRYEANGKPYIHLTTWEEHQRIRNKHRKYPCPTFDSNSLTNDRQLTASCQLESESESKSESEEEDIKIITQRVLEMGCSPDVVDKALRIYETEGYPKTMDFYQDILNTLMDDGIFNKEGYIYQIARNKA